MCGRSWPLAICCGSVCGCGPVVCTWPSCVVCFRPAGLFQKRGDDPGHRPKDRFFRPTDRPRAERALGSGMRGDDPRTDPLSGTPLRFTWPWDWLLGYVSLSSISVRRCGVTSTVCCGSGSFFSNVLGVHGWLQMVHLLSKRSSGGFYGTEQLSVSLRPSVLWRGNANRVPVCLLRLWCTLRLPPPLASVKKHLSLLVPARIATTDFRYVPVDTKHCASYGFPFVNGQAVQFRKCSFLYARMRSLDLAGSESLDGMKIDTSSLNWIASSCPVSIVVAKLQFRALWEHTRCGTHCRRSGQAVSTGVKVQSLIKSIFLHGPNAGAD